MRIRRKPPMAAACLPRGINLRCGQTPCFASQSRSGSAPDRPAPPSSFAATQQRTPLRRADRHRPLRSRPPSARRWRARQRPKSQPDCCTVPALTAAPPRQTLIVALAAKGASFRRTSTNPSPRLGCGGLVPSASTKRAAVSAMIRKSHCMTMILRPPRPAVKTSHPRPSRRPPKSPPSMRIPPRRPRAPRPAVQAHPAPPSMRTPARRPGAPLPAARASHVPQLQGETLSSVRANPSPAVSANPSTAVRANLSPHVRANQAVRSKQRDPMSGQVSADAQPNLSGGVHQHAL